MEFSFQNPSAGGLIDTTASQRTNSILVHVRYVYCIEITTKTTFFLLHHYSPIGCVCVTTTDRPTDRPTHPNCHTMSRRTPAFLKLCQ